MSMVPNLESSAPDLGVPVVCVPVPLSPLQPGTRPGTGTGLPHLPADLLPVPAPPGEAPFNRVQRSGSGSGKRRA